MSLEMLIAAARLALETLPGPTPKHTPEISEAVSVASEEGTCTGEWAKFDFCTPMWSGTPFELVIAEVAIGHFESGFQERIQAGKCRTYECDAKFGPGGVFLYHRARSYFQHQRTSFSKPFWEDMVGVELIPTLEAARATVRVLGAGYKKCRSVAGAVSWYSTHDCSAADKRAGFTDDLARKVTRKLRARDSARGS